MCTISYLPLKNQDYILTQNRDVGKKRVPATPPEVHLVDGQKLIYPVDPQGGGTWNAFTASHHAFILNGADFNYHPTEKGVRSRGELCIRIVSQPEDLFQTLDLSVFDHFTLVLVNTADRSIPIREWRWNGKDLRITEFSAREPHLWISPGLYSEDDNIRKKEAFREWIREEIDWKENVLIDVLSLNAWDWHHLVEVAGKEGFIIDRSYGVMTVSVLQTIKRKDKFSYRYEDLKSLEHFYSSGIEMH